MTSVEAWLRERGFEGVVLVGDGYLTLQVDPCDMTDDADRLHAELGALGLQVAVICLYAPGGAAEIQVFGLQEGDLTAPPLPAPRPRLTVLRGGGDDDA